MRATPNFCNDIFLRRTLSVVPTTTLIKHYPKSLPMDDGDEGFSYIYNCSLPYFLPFLVYLLLMMSPLLSSLMF